MSRAVYLGAFVAFFRSKSLGGILLLCCVLTSLLIANSSAGPGFIRLLETELGWETPAIHLRYSLITWINDGLMAVFFLLIGLEIKRELVEGELSSFRKAILPVVAATAGAIVPALIYASFNRGTEAAAGWGIPMATDIAFALALLSLLSDRVPPSLKIFLAALAIADDLIAILVIALFYSDGLHLTNLLYAGGLFLLLMAFNLLRVRALVFYIIPGLFIWYFIHHSGIHATIAGVVTAFTLPTTRGAEISPLEKLEHYLNRPVNFLIMPLFALANTAISLEDASVDMLLSGLGLGISLGLLLGKPIGIMFSVWLTVRTGLARLPTGAHWGHMLGLGILGGIGFTMSIFISVLSFSDPHLQNVAKISILVSSTLAGALGYFLLSRFRGGGGLHRFSA